METFCCELILSFHNVNFWQLEEAKKSFATYLQTNAAVTPHVPDHGPEFRKLMAQLSDDPR